MAFAGASTATSVRADAPSAEAAAAAQVLFDDAKAAMQRGDYATACPKLEESQRLQPAGGTLLFLGLCLEGAGKTATAWTRFNEALSVARRDARADRERVANEHIASLAPRLTRLAVAVADADKGIPGLRISCDGADVPAPIWGTAIPVDPGRHTLRASAPGARAWETAATTGKEGSTITVDVPVLERETAPAATATGGTTAATAPGGAPPSTTATGPAAGSDIAAPPGMPPSGDASATGRTQRLIALGVGGAGIVALGIGAYYGVTALSKKSEAAQPGNCPGGSSGGCYPGGVTLSHDAAQDGNIASVLLGVGAAAAAGAVVLWLVAPSSSSTSSPSAVGVTPMVARDAAGVRLGGAW